MSQPGGGRLSHLTANREASPPRPAPARKRHAPAALAHSIKMALFNTEPRLRRGRRGRPVTVDECGTAWGTTTPQRQLPQKRVVVVKMPPRELPRTGAASETPTARSAAPPGGTLKFCRDFSFFGRSPVFTSCFSWRSPRRCRCGCVPILPFLPFLLFSLCRPSRCEQGFPGVSCPRCR